MLAIHFIQSLSGSTDDQKNVNTTTVAEQMKRCGKRSREQGAADEMQICQKPLVTGLCPYEKMPLLPKDKCKEVVSIIKETIK